MTWLSDMPARLPGLYLKRGLDVVLSGVGLAALSPLLAGLTFAELAVHGWPPLFGQLRPGLGGRVFRMWKFRTMTEHRDVRGDLLPDDDRLTDFGRWLRCSSLDELPELWNVFTGDMSLVGPRPLLVQYLERYTPEQQRRHRMPPGITGWAQVNGRNAVSWDERFEMDVWYVDHWTLGLDLRILVMTVATVIRREGVRHGDHATMPEFLGSASRM
jgi:sugar transferase EpsL